MNNNLYALKDAGIYCFEKPIRAWKPGSVSSHKWIPLYGTYTIFITILCGWLSIFSTYKDTIDAVYASIETDLKIENDEELNIYVGKSWAIYLMIQSIYGISSFHKGSLR